MQEYKFIVTIRVRNPEEFICTEDDIGRFVEYGITGYNRRLDVADVTCEEEQV